MENNFIFRSDSVTFRTMTFIISDGDGVHYKHNELLRCPKRTAFKLCALPRIRHKPNRVTLRLACVNYPGFKLILNGEVYGTHDLQLAGAQQSGASYERPFLDTQLLHRDKTISS
jgi:hypothetical protein